MSPAAPAAASLRPAFLIIVLTAGAALLLPDESSRADAAPMRAFGVLVPLSANVLFAVLGWALRAVTLPGAATGAVIGSAIAIGSGWPAWALLVTMFAMVVTATRVGGAVKRLHGIQEPREGRRGPANAIANTGVAAGAACVYALTGSELAQTALVASLITSGSDTVASEIGKAWGRPTFQLLRAARVEPGTIGGVSAVGTAAGLASATALAALAITLGMVQPITAVGLAIAASAAGLVEGVIASIFEPRGVLSNHDVNVLNALGGAAMAVAWHVALTA